MRSCLEQSWTPEMYLSSLDFLQSVARLDERNIYINVGAI